ncbi:MAG: hypothetical protein OEQ29_22450 [Alphaproteobacteria bacterium]|nr:hypothetical protein [Alphaproteobacteria bacterium]
MRRTLFGLVIALAVMAAAAHTKAEAVAQKGTGSLTVKLPAAKASEAVTVSSTATTPVRLAGYMRLMICVNGRACGQGAAFWGGGPRTLEAGATCAFKPGAAAPKIVVRAKSCSARGPDAMAALTATVKPGAEAKHLQRAFHGNMSCAQVMQAAEKYCCEFKQRYKNPNGC